RAEATFWERGNDGGVSLPTIGGRKALTRADFRIRRNYRRDQLTPENRSVERKRCPCSLVDVRAVDAEDCRLVAPSRVLGRSALVGRCLGPGAHLVVPALQDASSFDLGDVLIPSAVVHGGDANLASVLRLEHDGVFADRVGGFDSVEPRELDPIERNRAAGRIGTGRRHRYSLPSRGERSKK